MIPLIETAWLDDVPRFSEPQGSSLEIASRRPVDCLLFQG